MWSHTEWIHTHVSNMSPPRYMFLNITLTSPPVNVTATPVYTPDNAHKCYLDLYLNITHWHVPVYTYIIAYMPNSQVLPYMYIPSVRRHVKSILLITTHTSQAFIPLVQSHSQIILCSQIPTHVLWHRHTIMCPYKCMHAAQVPHVCTNTPAPHICLSRYTHHVMCPHRSQLIQCSTHYWTLLM